MSLTPSLVMEHIPLTQLPYVLSFIKSHRSYQPSHGK